MNIVVLPLSAQPCVMSTGVALADKALIKKIRHDPGKFYFNGLNSVYPGGELRGQLYK